MPSGALPATRTRQVEAEADVAIALCDRPAGQPVQTRAAKPVPPFPSRLVAPDGLPGLVRASRRDELPRQCPGDAVGRTGDECAMVSDHRCSVAAVIPIVQFDD